MELQERITKGIKAKEVLENDVYIEAYALVKQEITDQWQNSPARDAQARETLYLMTKLVDKLKTVMQTTMETGKLAELELQHQETLAQKAKRVVSMRW
ncbi:MAG: hypothetical protein V4605_09580 [Pseudomonadota bacterium]